MLHRIIPITALIVILGCTKNDTNKFRKKTLLVESFNDSGPWEALPSNYGVSTNSDCVKFEDGLLKLSFDQGLQNCGCAWIGARRDLSPYDIFERTDKLGMRIKLEKGFFQQITTYKDTVVNGYAVQHGAIVLESHLRVRFNDFQITVPHWNYGYIHESIGVNPDLYKIEGQEFEVISDRGQIIFLIDGIQAPSEYVGINQMTTLSSYMEFKLGHQPEFSPRLDELFIDELEIYTWDGDLKF